MARDDRRRRSRKPKRRASRAAEAPRSDIAVNFEEAVRLSEISREERLKTVLEFIAEDLSRLDEAQRATRLRELFTLLRPMRIEAHPGPMVWEALAPPDSELVKKLPVFQEQLRQGVRDFLRQGTAWALPAPRLAVLMRHRDRSVRWIWQADAVAMMMAGAADLVWEYADRVRSCKTCSTFFLARKRQEYCSPAHGQAARDARKASAKQTRTS
jgi:hypothetical protein